MGPWSNSDRLAVALACLAGVMALVLFWIDKTPIAAAISLAVIAGLLVFPIFHFTHAPAVRVAMFIAAAILIGFFGWSIWPKKAAVTVETAKPAQQQAQTQPAPQLQPQTPPPPPKKKAVAPGGINTGIKQSGHHNTADPGGINNSDIHPGPCSVIQNGGSSNSASPACESVEARYGNLRQRAMEDLSQGLNLLVNRRAAIDQITPNMTGDQRNSAISSSVRRLSGEYIRRYDTDVRQVIEDFGKLNIRDPELDQMMSRIAELKKAKMTGDTSWIVLQPDVLSIARGLTRIASQIPAP